MLDFNNILDDLNDLVLDVLTIEEARKVVEVYCDDNDLSTSDHKIVVTVGPSSSSKRSATVRALTGMMQMTQDPETQNWISFLVHPPLCNIRPPGLAD